MGFSIIPQLYQLDYRTIKRDSDNKLYSTRFNVSKSLIGNTFSNYYNSLQQPVFDNIQLNGFPIETGIFTTSLNGLQYDTKTISYHNILEMNGMISMDLSNGNSYNKTPPPYLVTYTMPVMYNNKIYLIGGTSNSNILEDTYTQIYDIASDSWSIGAPLPQGNAYSNVCVINGKIYVIGGNPTFTKVQIYDITSNSWSTGTDIPIGTEEFTPIADNDNNKIYCIGGYHNGTISKVQIYDIASDSWSNGTDMLFPQHEYSAILINGKIYIIGGQNPTNNNKVQIYDIASDSWSTGANTLYGGGTTKVALQWNNKIYIINGYYGGRNIEEYDYLNDKWTYYKYKTPYQLVYFSPVISGNTIYLLGDRTSRNNTNRTTGTANSNVDYINGTTITKTFTALNSNAYIKKIKFKFNGAKYSSDTYNLSHPTITIKDNQGNILYNKEIAYSIDTSTGNDPEYFELNLDKNDYKRLFNENETLTLLFTTNNPGGNNDKTNFYTFNYDMNSIINFTDTNDIFYIIEARTENVISSYQELEINLIEPIDPSLIKSVVLSLDKSHYKISQPYNFTSYDFTIPQAILENEQGESLILLPNTKYELSFTNPITKLKLIFDSTYFEAFTGFVLYYF